MKFLLLNLMTLLKNLRHDQSNTSDKNCTTFLIASEEEKLPVKELSTNSWILAFENTNWLGPGTFELDFGCEKKINKECLQTIINIP